MGGKNLLDLARDRIRGVGARVTAPRVHVLATLLAASRALSHHDIEQTLGTARLDRVTLYRVLEWLVDEGLAHRISSADRVWRFSIAGEAHDTHAHFQCSRCTKVLCLDELTARNFPLPLPLGCRAERTEVTVTGVCADCGA